jgi:hypothetical protein
MQYFIMLFQEILLNLNLSQEVYTMYKYNRSLEVTCDQGRIQKLRRAEGGAKIFGVFRVKIHHFRQKKSYLFQF